MALVLTTQPIDLQLDMELTLESIAFVLRLEWSTRSQRWRYGFWADEETPILVGRRLIPGMFMNNRYTGELLPDGVFMCARLDGTTRPVGMNELGRDALIFYTPREEFEAEQAADAPLFQIVRVEAV